MNLQNRGLFKLLSFSSLLLMLASCTAGSDQFAADSPAGFWYGLWHGAIAIITLIIHIFTDTVTVYETNNTGGWYDLGFLLGVIFIWGGGCHAKCKSAERKKRDKEWDEIGDKVELKVMRKLKDWSKGEEEADKDNNDDWDEVCRKVEKKLKRKIREWAEKE